MGFLDDVKEDLRFLGGFKLTFQHLTRPRVTRQYPDEKKPKQPRQHGRHVLNRYEDGMEKCIGCELCAGVLPGRLHLRAGPRQPARPPGVAGRALRLRLRDQLPAVHPLRPVRRGLPHRGHHRVQALRVLLHQPGRRHLHQGRAGGGRRRAAPAPALGGLAGGRRPAHLGLDAGHRRRRAAPPTRARSSGPASWATACGRPRAASRAAATTRPPAPCRCARSSSPTSSTRTSPSSTGACGAGPGGPSCRPSATRPKSGQRPGSSRKGGQGGQGGGQATPVGEDDG